MAKVLHASYSGYFPSCLQVSDEFGVFTLEKAMEIYWRVKAWTISGTYVNQFNEIYDFSQTFTSTLADETRLVCLPRNYFPYFETDFTPQTDDAFFQRPSSFYINSARSLYGVSISFKFIPSGASRSIGTSGIDDPSTDVGVLDVLGKSIPFYAEAADGDEFLTSANGTMTPSAYWAYEA